jgi:glycosyltransferase involved in cell wall biosynthesis
MFSGLLRDAKAVIVNSQAVKYDIDKYYPEYRCRIFPLPFAPVPLPGWFDQDPDKYKKKYNLPDRYFMISNQFWIHKSHITAFEALCKFKKIFPASDIHIVCTGETGDYRFPKYFTSLKSRIDELHISDSIRYLGYIPKNDQLQIMRGAIAVLQPTLYEGGPGGGAVYDAVAMGIPSICSDIPVNKEIEGENLYFFRAGSSDDMTEKMLTLLKGSVGRPSREKLMEKGYQRAGRLGNALLEAIEFVVSPPPRSC